METTIDSIKKSTNKLYVSCTGGGSGFLPMLLANGGASSVFLGANIPYSPEELGHVIGGHGKSVSMAVALSLADVVSWQSERLAKEHKIVGIGATCSLKKSGDERADREHRIALAVKIITESETSVALRLEVVLAKGRTRKQEEELVARLILVAADQYLNGNKVHFLKDAKLLKAIGFTSGDLLNEV